MEVRKKRPRGFKKEAQGVQASPLNPPICCSLRGAGPETSRCSQGQRRAASSTRRVAMNTARRWCASRPTGTPACLRGCPQTARARTRRSHLSARRLQTRFERALRSSCP
jgi:hypothetical protein